MHAPTPAGIRSIRARSPRRRSAALGGELSQARHAAHRRRHADGLFEPPTELRVAEGRRLNQYSSRSWTWNSSVAQLSASTARRTAADGASRRNDTYSPWYG